MVRHQRSSNHLVVESHGKLKCASTIQRLCAPTSCAQSIPNPAATATGGLYELQCVTSESRDCDFVFWGLDYITLLTYRGLFWPADTGPSAIDQPFGDHSRIYQGTLLPDTFWSLVDIVSFAETAQFEHQGRLAVDGALEPLDGFDVFF